MDKLIEKFNRRIDYLRLSVTDRCNLRCIYCMPQEGIEPVLHKEVLTFEEITRLVNIFASLGIKKIRLTGGEPLIRKDIVNLIQYLVDIPGIEEVSLTTNAILLSDVAVELKKLGIKRLNISLDTLREERFRQITGYPSYYKVIEAIDKVKDLGFWPLKLNTVVMRGINDDEIIDFVEFALSKELILRFIEFMEVTPLWREDYFIPIEEVKKICASVFRLEKIDGNLGFGPAQYYKVGERGFLGFIKTDENNCQHCNRLRLTSTGELKSCLYQSQGISLRDLLRIKEDDECIKDTIKNLISLKEDIDYKRWQRPQIYMCSVGG